MYVFLCYIYLHTHTHTHMPAHLFHHYMLTIGRVIKTSTKSKPYIADIAVEFMVASFTRPSTRPTTKALMSTYTVNHLCMNMPPVHVSMSARHGLEHAKSNVYLSHIHSFMRDIFLEFDRMIVLILSDDTKSKNNNLDDW